MRKVLVSILLSALLVQTVFAEGYYYLYDNLGNVDVVTDETGEAVATYEYDPFGNTIEENIYDEDFENDYKYTGQEEDDETGLYYYNARYYSPGLGRFMSQDPAVYDDRLFEMIGDPQSLNPYTYVINNPVKYVDPSGEFWDVVWDIVNFVFDYATRDTDDMAIDLIAATIPGVPSVANVDDAARGAKKLADKAGDIVSAMTNKGDDIVSVSSRLEDLTKGASFMKNSDGLVQWGKTGGYDQALKDFEKLTDGVYDVSQDGKVFQATLEDGSKVSVRNFSSGGSPTIQIDQTDGTVIKYRYD